MIKCSSYSTYMQCCGSVTFLYGSGSCSFRDPQDANKKNQFYNFFLLFLFFKVLLHNY
jgi:hypothetical protein